VPLGLALTTTLRNRLDDVTNMRLDFVLRSVNPRVPLRSADHPRQQGGRREIINGKRVGANPTTLIYNYVHRQRRSRLERFYSEKNNSY
jgi:hypothetical protein